MKALDETTKTIQTIQLNMQIRFQHTCKIWICWSFD